MMASKNRKKLFPHQIEAINKLRTGSILLGGVGSGKTLTSLVYYYKWECGGDIKDYISDLSPRLIIKQIYVITTAKKRDSLDWEREAADLGISEELHVDSWNNIKKYKDVKDAFFIFDEQKVVGYGTWSKAFIKIAKNNNWILLTATPGDTWMDYISVFVANGFYRNKTEFIREHVIYNSFTHFPKVDRYVNVNKLNRLKNKILIRMNYTREVYKHHIDIITLFDSEKLKKITKEKWNIYKNRPIKNGAESCYLMRQVVNSDPSKLETSIKLIEKHQKIIIFYNFNYELYILRTLEDILPEYHIAEYNGHLHEDIPTGRKWVYLAQYISASEAWDCITTNAIIFYSSNYSYKLMTQAAGRIDRMTSEYVNLYYYYLNSLAPIDLGLKKALKNKTNFNEQDFIRTNKLFLNSRDNHSI